LERIEASRILSNPFWIYQDLEGCEQGGSLGADVGRQGAPDCGQPRNRQDSLAEECHSQLEAIREEGGDSGQDPRGCPEHWV
jgi:hypothetical protein